MAKTYKERKEEARQEAIDWQLALSDECVSYGELAYATAYFENKGKYYGLLKEFRENGIC